MHTQKEREGEFFLDDRECSAKPWPVRVSVYVNKSVFGNRERERKRDTQTYTERETVGETHTYSERKKERERVREREIS